MLYYTGFAGASALGLFRRGAKSGASGRNVEGAPLKIFGLEPKIARLMIFLVAVVVKLVNIHQQL